jgi:hypothetical protein
VLLFDHPQILTIDFHFTTNFKPRAPLLNQKSHTKYLPWREDSKKYGDLPFLLPWFKTAGSPHHVPSCQIRRRNTLFSYIDISIIWGYTDLDFRSRRKPKPTRRKIKVDIQPWRVTRGWNINVYVLSLFTDSHSHDLCRTCHDRRDFNTGIGYM